jgi:hypothetical protein
LLKKKENNKSELGFALTNNNESTFGSKLITTTKIESDFINLNKITNKLIQDSEF